MAFKEVAIESLSINPFTKLDKEWGLVAAGASTDASNCMTVSWGGMGVLWGKNVVTVYIRPQRYTKEFVDAQDRFTLSFFAPEHKRALGVLGAKSGRDGNKVAEVGFTPVELGGSVSYEQADLVFTCKKLYEGKICPENFLDKGIDEACYPEKDYHIVYIAEVEHVYERI